MNALHRSSLVSWPTLAQTDRMLHFRALSRCIVILQIATNTRSEPLQPARVSNYFGSQLTPHPQFPPSFA